MVMMQLPQICTCTVTLPAVCRSLGQFMVSGCFHSNAIMEYWRVNQLTIDQLRYSWCEGSRGIICIFTYNKKQDIGLNLIFFLDALPIPSYDILSSVNFDHSVSPGPKSVIASFSSDMTQCLSKIYSKIYPSNEHLFSTGQIFIPSTFKKYATITWHGKTLVSAVNKNANDCFVFVSPPFPFTSSHECDFGVKERLAKIEFFFLHTISLPNMAEPKSHLFACLKWPMIHPERYYYGKPVEVWCKSVYEPQPFNEFCLASEIAFRAIISTDIVCGECVRIAIPVVDWSSSCFVCA